MGLWVYWLGSPCAALSRIFVQESLSASGGWAADCGGCTSKPFFWASGREGRVLVLLGGWAAGAEQGRDFQLWEVFPALASAHPLLSVPTELLY